MSLIPTLDITFQLNILPIEKKKPMKFRLKVSTISFPCLNSSILGLDQKTFSTFRKTYFLYNSFLNYFYLFRKDFMTSKSAKSNVKFLEVL